MFSQFAPGRIDHHAPQIVTLMASFALLLRGLDGARAASLGAAAALMALSLAISLENIPFFAPMAGALLWLFVVDGVAARAQLRWFAAGVLVAFPLFFVATVAPSAYTHSACDAFSAPWLAGAIAASLGLMALAFAAPRLVSLRARVIAVAAVVATGLAVFAGIAPECLGGPFVGLDPQLRSLWLDHVQEVMPFHKLFAKSFGRAVAIAAPVALGLAAALWRARATRGVERRRWAIAAATIAVGLGASLLHMRVFTSVTPLAMAALAGGVSEFVARLDVSPVMRNTLAGLISLCLSPIGLRWRWRSRTKVKIRRKQKPSVGRPRRCRYFQPSRQGACSDRSIPGPSSSRIRRMRLSPRPITATITAISSPPRLSSRRQKRPRRARARREQR